jgi:hypothetical protein
MAYHNLPLNLAHAGTIAARLVARLDDEMDEGRATLSMDTALQLTELLAPYRMSGENPEAAEAEEVAAEAVELARRLVREIVLEDLRGDRVGQAVRNLFECLGHGKEGAEISLVAGENPTSIQRPS